MSDRIAVFNDGRDRAGRRARRGLRAARRRRSSPASSAPPTCSTAPRRARCSAATAPSASGPRRSASPSRRRRAATERQRAGTVARGRLPRRRHPLRRRRSTPAAALVAVQQNLTTPATDACRPRRTGAPRAGARRTPTALATARSEPDDRPARGGRRQHGGSMRRRRGLRSARRVGAARLAACGSRRARRRRRRRQRRQRRRARRPPSVPMRAARVGAGRGRAQHPRLGRATPRTARTTRRSTGCTPFEQQTGCKVNVKIGNTSDEMVTLMKTGAVRRGLRLRRRLAAADLRRRRRAGEHRLVPELRRRLRRSSRTRPGTRSTAQMYGIPHGWGANLLM